MKINIPINHAALGFLAIAYASFAGEAKPAKNTGTSDVEWTWTYDGDVSPTQAPPRWEKIGAVTEKNDGGILTIESGDTDACYYRIVGGGKNRHWDGASADGSTIEFRVRIVEKQNAFAGHFIILDGIKRYPLAFTADQVWFSTGSTGKESFGPDFNIFRITLRDGVANVYINNSKEIALSSTGEEVKVESNPRNEILFGFRNKYAKGIQEWDYIRWTNGGAFPPK